MENEIDYLELHFIVLLSFQVQYKQCTITLFNTVHEYFKIDSTISGVTAESNFINILSIECGFRFDFRLFEPFDFGCFKI